MKATRRGRIAIVSTCSLSVLALLLCAALPVLPTSAAPAAQASAYFAEAVPGSLTIAHPAGCYWQLGYLRIDNPFPGLPVYGVTFDSDTDAGRVQASGQEGDANNIVGGAAADLSIGSLFWGYDNGTSAYDAFAASYTTRPVSAFPFASDHYFFGLEAGFCGSTTVHLTNFHLVYYGVRPDDNPLGAPLTFSFDAIADNYIESYTPAANHDTDGLQIGDRIAGGGVQPSRALIQFNTSLVPPTAQIISASLFLTSSLTQFGTGDRDLDLYLLNTPWNETDSNWTDRRIEFDPGLGFNVARNWVTAGADTTDRLTPSRATFTADESTGVRYGVDVTEDVRSIVSGENPNYGWVIVDRNEEDNFLRAFYDSENADHTLRPELQITFADPGGAVDANRLHDGSFEEGSPDWEYSVGGRRIDDLESSASNFIAAPCSTHYAVIDGGFDSVNQRPTAITQRFYWPGGNAFFHMYARSNPDDLHAYQLFVVASRVDGTEPDVSLATPASYNFPPSDWLSINNTFSLSPGFYDLLIGVEGGSNGKPDIAIDDITLTLDQYMSYCAGIGGPSRTPYPSPTSTVTRTGTNTATAGASPTRTPTPNGSSTATATSTPGRALPGNCDFESGTNGWSGTDYTIALAGGPIGPRFADVAANGNISQLFGWFAPGGTAYFTFWIGPGSYGSVRVRNIQTGQVRTLYTPAAPATWELKTASQNLPVGVYRFEALGGGYGIKLDGVSISTNTFSYCGSSGGPITPTSGPTSFVTATSSPTPNASLSPTPSRTSSRTPTAANTVTPFPTNTPRPPNTAQPTNTQPATATQPAPQQTATAQGTDVPTYTPQPTYTPYPTTTPYATPPQQPPPGPGAECVPPGSGDIPGWMAYQQCQSLSFFSWSPTNTAQIQTWPTLAAGREPFSTMNQAGQFASDMQQLIGSTDWESTGSDYGSGAPDPIVFLHAAQGILTGNFQFGQLTYTFNENCNLLAASIIGPFITRGICIWLNLLCALGLLTWFQWLSNAVVIIVTAVYVKKNWIDKAMV